MPPVIQVSGVRKTYGRIVAVDEASFEVKDGEIFGLIGPNGAGKTTTMECIEGLRKPDRGTIAVLGLDPFSQVYKLQERIGVQLQQAQLQKRIKVWEAVDLWASLYRKKAVDGERLLEQLGLSDKRSSWFMDLSGGQKQRLLSASPLGPRLCAGSTFEPDPDGWDTSTNQSTFPLVSTCATRSVPKDATYMKLPPGSKATPAGCASAVLNACGLGRMA